LSLTVTATAVAWYAAIVSTASLLVMLYVACRDRQRLVVTAVPNTRVISPAAGEVSPRCIAIKVANHGRRPATIAGAYLVYRGGRESMAMESLFQPPVELAEGRATVYYVEQEDDDLTRINHVYVRDVTGRRWKGPLKRPARTRRLAVVSRTIRLWFAARYPRRSSVQATGRDPNAPLAP
jgi:hypothetical protein